VSERPQNKNLVPGAGGGNNGGGRPPNEKSVTYWAKQLLEAEDGKEAEAVAKSMIENAKGGNSSLLRELLDRVEGPVKQKSEVEHSGQVSYIILAPEAAEKI
jgi:hypothetical protein